MMDTTPPKTFPAAHALQRCRLCLHPRRNPSTRNPLNRIDWFKWPNAMITFMYEQVVGEQLLVSENLSELYCDTCYDWLDSTMLRIAEFKRVSAMWADHLGLVVKGEELLLLDDSLSISEPPPPPPMIVDPKVEFDEVEHLDYDGITENDDEDDQAMEMEILELSASDDGENYDTEDVQNADDVDPISCDICGDEFTSKAALLPHFRTVHGLTGHHPAAVDSSPSLPFGCDFCARRFKLERHMLRHRTSVHTDGPKRRCRYCHDEYPNSAALRLHYSTCATKLARSPLVRPPLQCDQCSAGYLRPNTLRRHYEVAHPEADWPAAERCICVRCFRQFDSDREARVHFEEVHDRWRCPVCNKLCMCAQSLERHVRVHSDKERRYRCDECDGTYVTGNQLKMHKRRKHSDERPFACDAPRCEKRYAERSELNVHVKAAHSSERYRCEWCDKDFSSQKYLNLHTAKEHTGGFKFFVCPVCERQFVNTRLLNAHVAVHHAGDGVKLEVEKGFKGVQLQHKILCD